MKKRRKKKRKLLFSIVPLSITVLLFLGITMAVGTIADEFIAAVSYDDVEDIVSEEDWEDVENYPATYVGVDDTDTAFSRSILVEVMKWSNGNNPFYDGYHGLCELWCADTYRKAGHVYKGACCAHNHMLKQAKKDGAIPKGALIFSGQKPDGSYYENGHRVQAFCPICKNWAGHVGIYIGGGKVVGSQVPYIYTIDSWISIFGYGGWSLQ